MVVRGGVGLGGVIDRGSFNVKVRRQQVVERRREEKGGKFN